MDFRSACGTTDFLYEILVIYSATEQESTFLPQCTYICISDDVGRQR